jgi:tRNA (guanine-N7-)-methyltransferase
MQPRSYAHAPRFPAGETVPLAELVPGAGPVLLEIGAGRGMFTAQYAALHPEYRVVALEIRRKFAAQLDERLRSRGLANARCFSEDARDALMRLSPDGGVACAAVHFPDPWWKKRHHKRLVVGDVVVAQLARLVAPAGIVFVQTDVRERADEYLRCFSAQPGFERIGAAPDLSGESPFVPARSNREARALADGLPIYRMVFRRVDAVGAGASAP